MPPDAAPPSPTRWALPQASSTTISTSPTKLTDALLGRTLLAYNTKHQLQSVTDANLHVVESYQYDDLYRVTSRTDNTGATDSYQYDPSGLLKQAIDRKGQVISQTSDEQDRPLTTSYADGTSLTCLYDVVGRLSRLTRGSEAISYTYDLADRVTGMVVTANGKTDTLIYQYDNFNRLTQRNVNNVITSYTYDKAKRIRTITHQGQLTTSNWDAASWLTLKVLPNGVTQSMVYDNANRMTQMTYRKTDNTIIEQISYTFDPIGQRPAHQQEHDERVSPSAGERLRGHLRQCQPVDAVDDQGHGCEQHR